MPLVVGSAFPVDTHADQYTVTAVFSIPSGESAGAKDVAITFPTPSGTIVFSKAGGFTVAAAANTAPSITQQPQAATVAPGGSVTFTIGEADINKIRQGQPVQFAVEALPGQTFEGKVEKVRLMGHAGPQGTTYTVEIATDNADGKLLPYLTARVQFLPDRQ